MAALAQMVYEAAASTVAGASQAHAPGPVLAFVTVLGALVATVAAVVVVVVVIVVAVVVVAAAVVTVVAKTVPNAQPARRSS